MQKINNKQEVKPINAVNSIESVKELTPVAETGDKAGIGRLFNYQWWKDIADRLLAFASLIILSPLLLLIAILIRLDSPGNAIFSHERVGKGGRKFLFYKFRSMYSDHDDSEYYKNIELYVKENVITPPSKNGEGNANNHDPRVTRMGRVLRKTNLDELPQFFNILKGDMSFVGPRPMIPFVVKMYNDHHKKSFSVKPGLTGLWQASGRKGLSFEDMIRLDLDYISRQSLLLDIKIVLLTVRAVLRGEGS